MAIELDSLEQRIIGVLIEKALTVPESYPLTLNQLVAGCNQKSNRDPVLTVEDFDVEGALRSLMDRGWVTRHEPYTGRVNRYAHEARSQLGLEAEDLAILSELLCRGPQAPGALKTRASRMRHLDSPAQVEDRLREMADRPVPYVERMEKLPRERQPRWRTSWARPHRWRLRAPTSTWPMTTSPSRRLRRHRRWPQTPRSSSAWLPWKPRSARCGSGLTTSTAPRSLRHRRPPIWRLDSLRVERRISLGHL